MLALALGSAPTARAQSPADRETAQTLYKAGNDARDAGDLATAAAKYTIAYALAPLPVIGLALGKAEVARLTLIEGRQTLLGVGRIPKKPHESELTSAARVESATLADELERRIPTVTLSLTRPVAGGPAAPIVRIDGTEIPQIAVEAPRRLNPGPHEVVATVGDARTVVKFTVEEAEAKTVVVEYPSAPAVAPPLPPPAPRLVAAPPPSRVPALVALGAGGAGVAVAAVFGVLALDDQSSLNRDCGSSKTSCPSSAKADINALHTNSVVSDVGLGVAVAGVSVGTVLMLVRSRNRPHERSPKLPGDGPRAVGVTAEPWWCARAFGVRGTF